MPLSRLLQFPGPVSSSPSPTPRPFPDGEPQRGLDLICFSHLRWDFVTQRPHHLLRRAARGCAVFFWEEPVWEDVLAAPGSSSALMTEEGRLEVSSPEPSIYRVRPILLRGTDPEPAQRLLLTKLVRAARLHRFISWYYTPMALAFSRELAPEVLVYDCMDELQNFAGAPPELAMREKELLARADVVFTGGAALYEAKRASHGNIHLFPSSIDAEHFAKAQNPLTTEPADQRDVPRPRAGFFGVIDERLDTALLADVARLAPDVHFVLLGPVAKIDPATLPQAANLHYLGSKKYEDLPAYLSGWNAALLPFALNDATRFISPTKTPEYLAAGIPVVSTPVQDVVRDYGQKGLVEIAKGAEAFCAALRRALRPQPAAWSEAVARHLSTNSWDRTWKAMWSEVERVLEPSSVKLQDTDAFSFAPAGPLVFPRERQASPATLHREVRALPSPSLDETHPLRTRQGGARFDYLVVGAGFAGAVLAERLASQLGQRVLVVDRRDHIAGNAYDHADAHGVLIHHYGPHIFHTNSAEVIRYLSQFTAWRNYEHRVLASVEGKLLPIPINLLTINQLYGLDLDSAGMQEFLRSATESERPAVIRSSEDVVVSRVGRQLFELFFRNYTRKQWGVEASALDSSVAGRIPVRFDTDDRYFSDMYQQMPATGYTSMFSRMLDHPLIMVRTGVDGLDASRVYRHARVIYTGPVDEYFGHRFGPLPYRSLEFRHETHATPVFQPAAVVNYPNDHDYTRVTEFKYLTGQTHPATSIVREYPQATGDPYYPIPCEANTALYEKYRTLAAQTDTIFCGRLGTYRYFNMDQVVAQSLMLFRRIAEKGSTAIPKPPLSASALPQPVRAGEFS